MFPFNQRFCFFSKMLGVGVVNPNSTPHQFTKLN